jgi:uncharacterized RDD family membrane protein YckC
MEKAKVVSIHDNGKRFGAFFMDAVVVAIFSMIFFAAIWAPIFGYYDTAEVVDTNATALESVTASSHLLSSLDEISPSADGEEAMTVSWIYNKSLTNPSDSTDFLYYYDCQYKSLDVSAYNAKFSFEGYGLTEEEKESNALLFAISDSSAPIAFSPTYKPLIYAYVKGTDSGTDATAAYSTAVEAFKVIYRADWTELGKSEAYLTPYANYYYANIKISYEAGEAALLSYVTSALLFYVALPFAFKRGRTLAQTTMHLEVISEKGNLISWQIIFRGLIKTVEFCGLSVFAPFFFIQFPSLLLPILEVGAFVIAMPEVVLASILILFLSGGLTLFTKEKTSLHDLATFTQVGDSMAINDNKRMLETVEADKNAGFEE